MTDIRTKAMWDTSPEAVKNVYLHAYVKNAYLDIYIYIYIYLKADASAAGPKRFRNHSIQWIGSAMFFRWFCWFIWLFGSLRIRHKMVNHLPNNDEIVVKIL